MVTLKVRDDSFIQIHVEVKRDHPDFQSILSAIKAMPGRVFDQESYCWLVPKQYARTIYEILEDRTIVALLSRESDLFGEPHTPVLPEFNVDNTYLDEMALAPFPFQEVGISFLHDIRRCIIGDEMGLGKTPQLIGAIWKLFREGTIRRALVVAPSSIIYQWKEEVEKFVPQATSIVIDGTVAKRKKIYNRIQSEEILFCIVGFETMRNDIDILKKMCWGCVALDEGHRIRNYNTQLTKAAKQLEAEYKYIATGTPIQKRPEEIWSLFSFIEPSIFGTWWFFRRKYVVTGEKFGQRNVVIGYKNLDELHDIINTRMLRRLKTDVDIQLPHLLINNYRIPMTQAQRNLHAMIDNDLKELVDQVESFRQYNELGEITREHPQAAKVLGLFTMLQEVADSPELILMSDTDLAAAYAPMCNAKSNKVDELKEILKDIFYYEPNAKVIIFSQYERMQRILQRELSPMGRCVILNGSMDAVAKQAAQNDFRFSDDARFFLSTDSGNYGINLQVASVVVNVDIPWNPAVWRQRYSRAHRLGSEHEHITVVNLLSMDSIDDSIYNTMYQRSMNADMLTDRDKEERKILATPDNGQIRRLLSTIRKIK